MLFLYMACLVTFFSMKLKKKSDAYLISIIIWMTTIYVSNEVFSIGNNLDFIHLFSFYGVLVACLIVAVLFKANKYHCNWKKTLGEFYNINIHHNKNVKLIAFFFVIIFLMGIVTIPHTVDSMTYGMTRIAYWTRNASVAHYATNDVRAVTSPPLAEFVNLQVYILHQQKDNFFTLLQTSSFITNAILVWGICRKLEIDRKYCYIGLLLFISMPIAFAEAFTTQVEQFATLWLLIFVYYILDFVNCEFRFTLSKEVCSKVLVLGACISFGYMAKPSVMFGMLVFALWLLLACIKRRDNVKPILFFIILAGVEIVLLVAPELGRNLVTFHAFSAPSVGAKHMIDTLNPLYLLVNFMKNISINVSTIYLPWMTKLVHHGVCWISYILGIDIDDPLIAHDGVEYIIREPGWYLCDSAVNPIILYGTLVACIWLLVKIINKEKSIFVDTYSYVAIFSFFLFCFALKYELYGVRYMLSYLTILCPVIAGQLSDIAKKYSKAEKNIIPILLFICVVELSGLFVYHGERTIRHAIAEDNIEGYFEFRENDELRYREVADYLNEQDYRNLGVYLGWTAGEYPIWKMVENDVHIDTVNVTNETAVYADEKFIPDYIIVKNAELSDVENYKGNTYMLVKNIDDLIYILKRK